MKKVLSVKHNKIWGYEKWLYSPVSGLETPFEDGTLPKEGPLVKILKTTAPLSVQVHPDDEMAQKVEGQPNGKSESWFVLDSLPDAEMVLGLKTYDKNEIQNLINENKFDQALNKVKVAANHFYNIPAGLVHGLGAGIIAFEVQQPSDVTYRYYDYGRLENGRPRELHIEKALMAQKDISYELEPLSHDPLIFDNHLYRQEFRTRPCYIKGRAIAIDLNLLEAYIAEDEEVKFEKFVIIPF